jgi:FkbM family methyltransferase
MKGDLVFDVGMNNGDDTAHYLERGFRVVAIEADPTLVEQGRARFAGAIRAGRLEIVNAAVGPKDEIADFWICDEKREWNSFHRSVASRNSLPHHAIPVRCRRFRDLLAQYGTPFYLKIDIEGHDQYCIDDLDPADLPRYVSLEMGPFETLFQLRDLGYTAFKLITQNDHSQLAIDPFSVRQQLKRRLQPYPPLYRLGRRLGGAWPVHDGDEGSPAAATNGHGRFPFGSSGPFAEETPGTWQTIEQAAFTWTAYQLGHSRYGQPGLNVWHDVHARRPEDR